MNIIQKLDELAELEAHSNLLEIKKQELIATVLTPAIQAELAGIDVEFAPQFDAISSKASEMKKEIKAEVIEHGQTVKGSGYQAVYSKGRTKWNDEGLMNYLSVHPEIAYLRTTGKPSVSFRKVK